MTEELNNFCTDLKDLFMQQDFAALEEALATKENADIVQMMYSQHEIVKNYFEQEKFDMLFSHLNFVAFASYLFEYTAKKGMITKEEYDGGMKIYMGIFTMLQQLKGQE